MFFFFFSPLEEEPFGRSNRNSSQFECSFELEERGAAAKTGQEPKGKKTDVT